MKHDRNPAIESILSDAELHHCVITRNNYSIFLVHPAQINLSSDASVYSAIHEFNQNYAFFTSSIIDLATTFGHGSHPCHGRYQLLQRRP